MSQYTLLTTQDNVESTLRAGISASVTSFLLAEGGGSDFPSTVNGSASSDGDAVTLNCTGIGAMGLVAGDFIWNVTDNASAVVVSVDTDSVTTTPLKGGADNTWQDADVFAVRPFIVTLNKRDSNGAIITHEKVLIQARSGDTLTVHTNGRGYDGSTAQEFDAEDYVNIFVTSRTLDEMTKALSTLFSDKAEDSATVHKTGDETVAGVKTFSSAPKSSVDASASDDLVRKSQLDAALGVDDFLDLSDTPTTYGGAGKILSVNGTNDGVECSDVVVDNVLSGVQTICYSLPSGTGERTFTINHSLGKVPKAIIFDTQTQTSSTTAFVYAPIFWSSNGGLPVTKNLFYQVSGTTMYMSLTAVSVTSSQITLTVNSGDHTFGVSNLSLLAFS